jgi:hypothetical protein
VDGARLELAFHGCRPRVIPLYEPPHLGRDENRTLVTGATIQCLSHSANPAVESGASRVNRTLVREVQALCTATVLDQQTLELARSLELRSGAYHAPALPVELYQRSWRDDSNADHGLTRPELFPLSYTSEKLWRWRGELHSR